MQLCISTGQVEVSNFLERKSTSYSRNFTTYLTSIKPFSRLANDKPSAIFRLRGSFTTDTSNTPTAFTSMGTTPLDPSSTDVTAILGIAVEPVHVIQGELASIPLSIMAKPFGLADTTLLAERIVKHLLNYLAGFATNAPIGGIEAENWVQLGVVQRWYESFVAKVRAGGIGFLERDSS